MTFAQWLVVFICLAIVALIVVHSRMRRPDEPLRRAVNLKLLDE